MRYTHECKSFEDFLLNYGLPNPVTHLCDAGTSDPGSPYPPQFCRIDVDNTGASRSVHTYSAVSWKAGVEFDLADRSMAYANVSTGFKSGGFFSAPPPNSFRPEKLTAFAAGVKNRFLDNRLQVNVEAFYWRYKDHQETSVGPTSIPGFFALLTHNAERAMSMARILTWFSSQRRATNSASRCSTTKPSTIRSPTMLRLSLPPASLRR